MKHKLDWQPSCCNTGVRAMVGSVTVYCFRNLPKTSDKTRWYGVACLDNTRWSRTGDDKSSLAAAKRDAVKMGHELLLDFKAAIQIELDKYEREINEGNTV